MAKEDGWLDDPDWGDLPTYAAATCAQLEHVQDLLGKAVVIPGEIACTHDHLCSRSVHA